MSWLSCWNCKKVILEIYLQCHIEDVLFRKHFKQYQYCILLSVITLIDLIRHIIFKY